MYQRAIIGVGVHHDRDSDHRFWDDAIIGRRLLGVADVILAMSDSKTINN